MSRKTGARCLLSPQGETSEVLCPTQPLWFIWKMDPDTVAVAGCGLQRSEPPWAARWTAGKSATLVSRYLESFPFSLAGVGGEPAGGPPPLRSFPGQNGVPASFWVCRRGGG